MNIISLTGSYIQGIELLWFRNVVEWVFYLPNTFHFYDKSLNNIALAQISSFSVEIYLSQLKPICYTVGENMLEEMTGIWVFIRYNWYLYVYV